MVGGRRWPNCGWILDSFSRLARSVVDASDAASELDPLERVMACAHVHRSWAIQRELFGPFVAALDALDGNPCTEPGVRAIADERVALWGLMHGLVMLEINHHLPFVDETAQVFDRALRRSIQS